MDSLLLTMHLENKLLSQLLYNNIYNASLETVDLPG